MNRRVYSCVLAPALVLAAASASPPELEREFAKPPQAARPLVWWHWINGNVTREGIDADLEDMKRAGIAGVQMFDVSLYTPPGPVRYGSDTWHEHLQYAIRACARLGLEFAIMNCPGWSASGGPWVTPERSMKKLVWSEVELQGPRAVRQRLPEPERRLDYYHDVAVIAIPANAKRLAGWERKTGLSADPIRRTALWRLRERDAIPARQVIDLTRQMDPAGEVAWDVPAGRWTILRFGYTTTGSTNHPAVPEGHGLEIDKLDPEAVAFQFDRALGRVLRDAAPFLSKTFNGILFDSFEGGLQNWTGRLPADFRRIHGYDLTPYLPVLTGRVIESEAVSEAVLWDFRKALDELFARHYFGTMQTLARRHGLRVYAEAQGGPLNPLLGNEYVDVPMNEFWTHNAAERRPRMKITVSAAGVLGKPIVAAEAFTAVPEHGKWQNTPYSLKALGDLAFAAGINRFIFHSYIHQPFTDAAPGFTHGRYGTHFGRLNTWWKLAPAWIDYLARSQSLLQRGERVADVLLVAHQDLRYAPPEAAAQVPPASTTTSFMSSTSRRTWRGSTGSSCCRSIPICHCRRCAKFRAC